MNKVGEEPVQVVVFEGWCVGFRALGDEVLVRKWEAAKQEATQEGYSGRLGKLELEHVKFVNESLKEYDVLTE